MRKFNGLLLVSDFDNTLVYTEEALQKCVDMPPVSDENRAAIEYFMANGGIFSVATGRAKPAFETVVDGIPMNGPTVLFNGAAIYDFPQKSTWSRPSCLTPSGSTSRRSSPPCPRWLWSCTTMTTPSTP